MTLKILLTTVALTWTFHAMGQETKPIEVDAYEQCALRVFSYSNKVSDVMKECEAEMNAFVATHDERHRNAIRHRTEVETKKALTQMHIQEKRAAKADKKSARKGGDE